METHECVYKLYHDFEQKIETPQGFINALQRLQGLLIDDFQNYEVVKGWLEFIRQQPFYNVTKLFSTCMTRSLLDDLQREKVVDSMLSTQTLVSEE
ncbi:hypothetical protein QGP82_20715 [Leptothoe sp. LEGE 181152]|nr:hypothetical protein [Leptothoe sp. LEGE 181152]